MSTTTIKLQPADDTYKIVTVTTGAPSGGTNDPDLDAIAALDATQSGVIASDGSGWIRKTYAQTKTALAISKSDLVLGNVDNTSDALKPISSATQTALNAKQAAAPNLTSLAGIDATTAGTIANDGAGWIKKTYAQLRTALGVDQSSLDDRYSQQSTLAINPAWPGYGAKFDDSTNDTTAIQNAIGDAGDTRAVYLQGTARVTGLTLGNYTKLIANGATLKRYSGTNPLITVPDQASLQTGKFSCVKGVLLDGVTIASGTVGLSIGNHAAFIMQDVRAINLDTGYAISGGQFGSSYSCKAYGCTVGMFIESRLVTGGGNSWSFHDFQAIGNTLGVVVVNRSGGTIPHHSLLFRNPTLTSNSVCGLAAFSVTNMIVDGSANEANASGSSTTTYSGVTVKKSSVYLNNSRVTFTNSFVPEASADPCFLAENGSVVSFSDMAGYGLTTGKFFSADSTSSCSLGGTMDVIGYVDNVTSSTANIASSQLGMLAPPRVSFTSALPNDIAQPQTLVFADTNGAVGSSSGTDATYGAYTSVHFAASVGSQGSNRVRISTTYAGTTAVFSVLAQSDVATTLQVGGFGNIGNELYKLPAGQWIRLVWLYVGVTPGTQNFIINPTDSAGASVKFCLVEQLSGTDTPTLRGQINAIASGAYNPKVAYPVIGEATWLKAAALAQSFILTGSETYDAAYGTLTSANIAWPDGTTGLYATTSLDSNGAVLGFTTTYAGATTKTVTVAIPRNSSGQVSGTMTAMVA